MSIDINFFQKVLHKISLKKLFNRTYFYIKGSRGKFKINGTYDHTLKDYLIRLPYYDRFLPHLSSINKKMVIDIGANIGDTMTLIKSVSNVDIVCVEPDNQFLNILKQNISENNFNNVTIYPFAISSNQKNILIKKNDVESTGFIIESDEGIPTKTFEELINELNIDFSDVGIVKIDTDGYDWDCLSSLYQYLDKNQLDLDYIFYEHQTAINSKLNNIQIRKDGEKKYLKSLKNLSSIGFNQYFIFDNFGSFITHTTNLELLQNIVKYTRKSQLDNKKPSIYFCDILITKNKNVESTFYAIKMLDKNTISVL